MSLSNIWFTSDTHLGHKSIAKHRGFSSIEEHDAAVVENMQVIGKRDKLFILGDVAWKRKDLYLLNEIPGTKELIIGNHDTLPTEEYLKYFNKVHGFRQYKHLWLSHCPIHPQEIYRCRGSVHGHLHNGAATKNIGGDYFNVNLDYNDMKPVNFTVIDEYFTNREEKQSNG